MTVLQPASWRDVLFMEDFLECASAAFDTIPLGVCVAVVDVMFRRWIGYAAGGRTDPDWPPDLLHQDGASPCHQRQDSRRRLYPWKNRQENH
jgi:hypothetical protein